MIAQIIQLLAHSAGDRTKVTGIDANPTELRSTYLHCGLDALGDVIGIDQQSGVYAKGVDLGAEGGLFVRGTIRVGMCQGPGVGGSAGDRNAVAVACL